MEYISIQDIGHSGFYPLSKSLFANPHYQVKIKKIKKIKKEDKEVVVIKEKLSDTSKIMYGILCERLNSSLANGWWDEQKRVYVMYSLDTLAKILNKSKDTIIACKKELQENGLLEIQSTGTGKADRIFLGKVKPRPEENFVMEVEDRISFAQPVENVDQSKTSPQPVENVDPNRSKVSTQLKYINKILIKSMEDNLDGLALLEKTFKEIGVSFTDKNQLSIAKLLKTMKLDDVVTYIKELYEGLSQDKGVKDLPALFSTKLEKGERIVKKKENVKTAKNVIAIPAKTQVSSEKEVREKIKSKTNYWLDHYIAFGNKTEALNGLVGNMSEYFEDYSQICEEYYNKLSDKINQIENKKGA